MIGIIRRRRIFWFLIFAATSTVFIYAWYINIYNSRESLTVRPLPTSTTRTLTNEYPEEPDDLPEQKTPNDYEHIELEFSDPVEIKDGQYVDGKIIVDDISLSALESEMRWNSSELRFQQLTLPEPIVEHMKNPMAFHLETMTPDPQDATTVNSDKQSLSEKGNSSGLIINTPGCQLPKFDPFDASISDLYNETIGKFPCNGPMSILTSHANGSITVNERALYIYYNRTKNDVFCHYQSIERVSQEERNYNREENINMSGVKFIEFGKPLPEDYVVVVCRIKGGMSSEDKIIQHYFALVHIKEEVEEGKPQIISTEDELNIIVAGIDSISKLNFLRHFPKTKQFLKENMSAFDMMGYTKVGDNTFPNLVPLLTGHPVEHYFNESQMDTMYFDHLDFIWKNYADKGYRTLYAEDHPVAGTFNHNKRGFKYPPTDYYYRPISIALDFAKVESGLGHECYNSDSDTDMIYNYLRNFITAMDNRPFFTFTMVSTVTHDRLNNAGYEDEPTYQLLEDLWNGGTLNKSMLVLFSDHGIRYGEILERYIGKFEERLPFMYIYFPDWYLKKYPQIASNLSINKQRLTSAFDVHATLFHLLHFGDENFPDMTNTEGLSLIDEIPPQRTCEEARIGPHFCACQTFEEISASDGNGIRSIQTVVSVMNKQLKEHLQCSPLELDYAMDIRLGKINDKEFLKFNYVDVDDNDTSPISHKGDVSPMFDYLVTFKTKPGGAIFEGTVRHDIESNSFDVLGISRINVYGNQSHCIESPKLKLYCYCEEWRFAFGVDIM